jgi:hypothetical protein
VKCDEEKPSCKRCVKWQGFCGGYEIPAQSAASPSSGAGGSAGSAGTGAGEDSQAKKGQARPRAKPRRRASSRSLSESTDQPSPLLQTEAAAIFTGWSELIGTLGGSFFQEEFWNRIVPKLSQENLAVRYASMAIDAVRTLVADSEFLSPRETAPKASTYDDALTYYGNAIQEMTRTQYNLRTSVVCCILFICFEILQGDRKTAIAHVFNGKRMVDELWDQALQAPPGGRFGGPTPIESDILEVFQRLSLHAWASKGTQSWLSRPAGDVQHPPNPSILSPNDMPSTFVAHNDARFWWQVTQYHILLIDSEAGGLTTPETGDHGEPDKRRGLDPLGPGHGDSGQRALWLAKWDAAFQPLFARSMADRSGSMTAFLHAGCLRVEFLHLFVFVHSPIKVGLARNDDMSGYFGEIVHLCSMMAPSQNIETGLRENPFNAESAVSFALFAVVIRSQQRRLCHDAFELLTQYVGEEQVWDRGRTMGRGGMDMPEASTGQVSVPPGLGTGGWAQSTMMEGNPAGEDEWAVDEELGNFIVQDFG